MDTEFGDRVPAVGGGQRDSSVSPPQLEVEGDGIPHVLQPGHAQLQVYGDLGDSRGEGQVGAQPQWVMGTAGTSRPLTRAPAFMGLPNSQSTTRVPFSFLGLQLSFSCPCRVGTWDGDTSWTPHEPTTLGTCTS